MVYQTRFELVDKIYRHAIAKLVAAVAGQKATREPYSEAIIDRGLNLVKAFKIEGRYDSPKWLIDEKADDAIAALVDALVGEEVARGPYDEDVYGP